ncbi:anthrone oxygenase family protein [Streptomyces otsuchiensis]|uniref:anthrone oxygenase family protein n=1 Tax=Streptomyces otsuchiensis TaxID=2681388 RepID=UPI0010322A34|nr:anthrone oxygenase family protein [Streptomyces otsuchiensis]
MNSTSPTRISLARAAGYAASATSGTRAVPHPAAGPSLLAATVGTGLMAGLYLAFDVAVMPALAAREDEEFVTTMRRVNDALDDDAAFGALFLGVFLATGVSAAALRREDAVEAARRARSAALWYGASVVLTVLVNLPLNRRLAQAGTADAGAARRGYERPWRLANAARTASCLAAFVALGRVAVSRRRAASPV